MKKIPLILTLLSTPALSALPPYATWYRPSTNTAYLYLRNTTDKPLTLDKLSINQTEESPTPWPLDPHRQSDWFDMTPPTLPPNQVAQIRVHLRQPPTTPIELTATTPAGTCTATIPPTAPTLTFSDITFSPTTISLFTTNATTPITQVLVDGSDQTQNCDLTAATPHQRVAAAFYHPATPFPRGSYHTYELLTADHHHALYTLRTLTNPFIIGTYGQPNFPLYHDSAINLYISFGNIPPTKIADLANLGMTASPVPFKGGQINSKSKQYEPLDIDTTTHNIQSLSSTSNQQLATSNSPLAFYSAPDEPDGADHPLGVGTHARSIISMRNLAYNLDPSTPTFVQIDNTYRDFNYHIYAESMDYSATHRYNLGQSFLAEDFSAMSQLRSSTAPQPYLWVTQLYPIREKVGEHSNYNGRDPLPPEMHLQMLESLAGGSKGFIHYIHSGSKGGRGGSGLNTSLWNSMVPMHQQIAAIGDIAVHSTPVPWSTSSDPRLTPQLLFSTPNDLLLVLINNAIQSTKSDCIIPDIENAIITITLPPYSHITQVTQILPGGTPQKTDFTQQNNILTLHPTHLDVGTIYRLQGDHP